eukprot:356295-Chlamydomonas_euryale.AAC.1
MSKKICQAGRCHCGAVEYKVDGDIVFNALCHCKNCTRAVGASPLHIIGVAPKTALTVTKVRMSRGALFLNVAGRPRARHCEPGGSRLEGINQGTGAFRHAVGIALHHGLDSPYRRLAGARVDALAHQTGV